VGWPKNERAALTNQSGSISLFYLNRSSFEECDSRMYTLGIALFVSRRPPAVGPSPVSTRVVFTITLRSWRGTVRFLLWWLFLHRRLRSRQRGPNLRSSDSALPGCTFRRASPVFIRMTQEPLRIPWLDLSVSTQGVNNSCFPLPLFSSNASPPLLASPCAGQSARKQPRLCAHSIAHEN